MYIHKQYIKQYYLRGQICHCSSTWNEGKIVRYKKFNNESESIIEYQILWQIITGIICIWHIFIKQVEKEVRKI